MCQSCFRAFQGTAPQEMTFHVDIGPCWTGCVQGSVGSNVQWKKWGLADCAAYECGAPEQTVEHIMTTCPLYRPPSEASLFDVGPETRAWLQDTELELWCYTKYCVAFHYDSDTSVSVHLCGDLSAGLTGWHSFRGLVTLDLILAELPFHIRKPTPVQRFVVFVCFFLIGLSILLDISNEVRVWKWHALITRCQFLLVGAKRGTDMFSPLKLQSIKFFSVHMTRGWQDSKYGNVCEGTVGWHLLRLLWSWSRLPPV